MKKAGVLILALVLMFFNTFTAFAAGEFQNVQELFEHWEENGYPDYVSSVFSADGTQNLTILLVDMEKEDEIRAMLRNSSEVKFGSGAISQIDMLNIHAEIMEEHIPNDSLIYALGIGWARINGELTGFGESKRESRVIVWVDEQVLDKYREKFRELYGDIIYVEVMGPPEAPGEGVKESEEPAEETADIRKDLNFIFVLLPLGFIMIIAAVSSTRLKQESQE